MIIFITGSNHLLVWLEQQYKNIYILLPMNLKQMFGIFLINWKFI